MEIESLEVMPFTFLQKNTVIFDFIGNSRTFALNN